MVQNADATSQARSIIGRFPHLAGKRALVTGTAAVRAMRAVLPGGCFQEPAPSGTELTVMIRAMRSVCLAF
jgi:hypothetical protein